MCFLNPISKIDCQSVISTITTIKLSENNINLGMFHGENIVILEKNAQKSKELMISKCNSPPKSNRSYLSYNKDRYIMCLVKGMVRNEKHSISRSTKRLCVLCTRFNHKTIFFFCKEP